LVAAGIKFIFGVSIRKKREARFGLTPLKFF